MEILRFKLWNDHDADALTADENGDYVSYATHRAMLEKMEERAIAAESKLERLPADWEKDSSLKTWFPLTNEMYERTLVENQELRSKLEEMAKAEPYAYVHIDAEGDEDFYKEIQKTEPYCEPNRELSWHEDIYESFGEERINFSLSQGHELSVIPLFLHPQVQSNADKEIPEGCKLVPIEPTDAMAVAAIKAALAAPNQINGVNLWREMIIASPNL